MKFKFQNFRYSCETSETVVFSQIDYFFLVFSPRQETIPSGSLCVGFKLRQIGILWIGFVGALILSGVRRV